MSSVEPPGPVEPCRIVHPGWFRWGVLAATVLAVIGCGALAPIGLIAIPFVAVAGWRLGSAEVVATADELTVRNSVRTHRIPASEIDGWLNIDGQIGVETTTGQIVLFDAARSTSLRPRARAAQAEAMLHKLAASQRARS